MLEACGLSPQSIPIDIDERGLEDRFLAAGGEIEGLATELARAKAMAASALAPEFYCLGADQTLIVGSRLQHKARTPPRRRADLAGLTGRTHRLISAFCIARGARLSAIDRDEAELDYAPA